MPQGPIGTSINAGGKTKLNITAATVVKAAPGTILSVVVVVAGSGAGSIYDLATNAPAAASKIIGTPATLGAIAGIQFWPCAVGILVVPGTGQTIAIAYQ